jgi:hypothetical protein
LPGADPVVQAALGYAQEVITLTDETEVLSVFDPWVIVPPYLAAPRAWHFVVGATAYLDDHFSVDVEAYDKPMDNLVDINEGKLKPEANDFINVTGRSYGVECMIRFDPGAFLFQGSYAIGRAERVHNGSVYIPKYDVRHMAHALVAYDFGTDFRVSTSWTLKTGLPFTPIVGFYDRLTLTPGSPASIFNPSEPVPLWGARNSSRLPVYHRLDVSASWMFSLDPFQATLEISLMNLYDRKNIFYYDRDTGEEVTCPFLPSVSLRWHTGETPCGAGTSVDPDMVAVHFLERAIRDKDVLILHYQLPAWCTTATRSCESEPMKAQITA